ncbi:glycosyltransferase [Roseofilum sp. BLCC_M91]|uniref:Glycosyltransferase n=1 Tax=Roseofilum halophilum BLCC-M91 TaxID=3022259 RepID=A0ABT7BLX7_9CYAN|nr:glycosyltransferase [Roseofilum halophilum]MDJ1179466.1 glycosyltransferase [Roseofilum halophilum BLCC-M91]
MLKKLIQKRIFKFLLGGGVAASVNLLLIFILIERLGFNTPFLRNLANTLSIEFSLLLSFFIYRIWVWPGGSWKIREVLFKQIPLYHLSAGLAVITRIFFLFPLLDWLGVTYQINTLIGVLLSAAINYVITDKFVFQFKTQSPDYLNNSKQLDLGYPEGLEPALALERQKTQKIVSSSSHLTKTGVFVDLLSIVIPAYNEEGSIGETLQSISERLETKNINYEILVVNDNSRDRTEEILKHISRQNHKIRYMNNYYPNGFGFAVRCGLENFQGDAVVIVMGDSSDNPEDIISYYYKLQEGYECVFGSRFMKGSQIIDYPTHKLIVNRMANFFVKMLFSLDYNDTTNAFKAYRREVIEGIFPLLSHHFNLTVEMPLKAIARGYTYTTIPITWRNRKTGVSKLKIKEMGSRYLFIVLYVFLEKQLSRGDYIRKKNSKILH